MKKPVRVRFAPSPTGPLHIGGVRTALFNYLFAKGHNGELVLRIEDTDVKRTVEGAESYIVEALNWCNITFNEGPEKEGQYGPYRQSERKKIYKNHIETLLKKNAAYYAFDSAEDLDLERKKHEAQGKTFVYNWSNRAEGELINSLVLSEQEVQKRLSSDVPYVVRFMTPIMEKININDLVRGNITIDPKTLDDKILFKSDGMPTYHLANVVDDYLMEISHVIRGEEWLPSLPLHQLLYSAFGWPSPKFAHLPLILKPKGKGKLSKRDGDKLGFPVFPLQWKEKGAQSIGYKEAGYLPEAIINFLALLGWNPGTEQELFSLDELVKCFSLEQVNKAGARFDPEKIKWFNQKYLQKMQSSSLIELLIKQRPFLKAMDKSSLLRVIDLVKERAVLSNDIWRLCYYFFESPKNYNENALKKAWRSESDGLMDSLCKALIAFDDSSIILLKAQIKGWVENSGVGFSKVMMPLRVALVGGLEGADIFEIIHFIGKDETIARIQHLRDKA